MNKSIGVVGVIRSFDAVSEPIAKSRSSAGFDRPSAGRAIASFCVRLVSAVLVATSCASAADKPDPRAYSDSGMMGAARSAASPGATDRPVNIGIPPPDELRVLEARREAEMKRLSEKLKRLEARNPQQRGTQQSADNAGSAKVQEWSTEVATETEDTIDISQRSALGRTSSAGQQGPTHDSVSDVGTRGKATILLVMAPRERRAQDRAGTADPILCVQDGCFVSNGAQAPATYHSFSQAVGIVGRIARGAGECNRSLVCVFRGIDIGSDTAMVQPYDLQQGNRGSRIQSEVAIDTSCRVVEGHLSCNRPVRTEAYSLWIVPEAVAQQIGPEALNKALADGLRPSRAAELPWQMR